MVFPAVPGPCPAVGGFGPEQVAGEAAAVAVSRGAVTGQPQLVQGKVLVQEAELLSAGTQFEIFVGWSSLGGVQFACC